MAIALPPNKTSKIASLLLFPAPSSAGEEHLPAPASTDPSMSVSTSADVAGRLKAQLPLYLPSLL